MTTSHANRRFRANAATLLGQIGQSTKFALICALTHENVIVRWAVALSLIDTPQEEINRDGNIDTSTS